MQQNTDQNINFSIFLRVPPTLSTDCEQTADSTAPKVNSLL